MSDRDLYEKLMRERYGDPEVLAREATNAVPPAPPPGVFPPPYRPRLRDDAPIPRRTPEGAGPYADEYRRITRWLARSHPEFEQQLAVFDNRQTAHVVVERLRSGRARTACGKTGETLPASDTIPPCRVCTWTPKRPTPTTEERPNG